MTVPLSFPLPSHQFSEKKTNAKKQRTENSCNARCFAMWKKKSTIEMNATNASTKSSPKNEKCSPLSLFKRQNATNAYCTQCRTQANALAGPPWAFLLLADIRTTSPPHLPKLLPSPSPIFPPLPRLNKLVPSPPSSLFLRHQAAIPVACGHFRAAPPTLTRATAADIRGLSPLLYHQRCRQGVPSAICTNTVTTKPPHGGEEFTSTSFSWCGGLLCNLWWIW